MWQYRCKWSWVFSPDLLVRLRLRRAGCRLRQRTGNGAACQIDFECVVREAPGIAQQDVGSAGEGRWAGALSAQRRFGRLIAPRLVGHSTECQAGLRDRIAVELQRGCDGDECERIGQAV